jgi:streptogramin lyase
MVSGPRDNLWFSEFLGGKIGEFVSANSSFREFRIPEPGARPAALALDTSGRIWFADQSGTGSVWMLDPSTSQFVQYKTKTTNSTPLFVLIDEGGDVWFTELTGNNLGELVYPTYSMLEFSLPTPSSGPAELVLQRNASRIWITETYDNKLASFDLASHSFVEYSPSVSLKSPIGIVVDRGGRLWLSEHGGSSIVEFDPKVLTWRKYPTSLPPPSAQYGISAPATLALDGRGNLWFVEHFSNRVGRLNSTSGSIDEFVIQTPGGYAYSVQNALDSGGNFWFTDYSANEINFVPANSTPPVSVAAGGGGAIPSIGAGETLSNHVLVRNRISVPLRITLNASATFSPSGQPSNGEVALNVSTLSLSPGGSTAVGVSITPESGVTSGLYSVGVIASAGNSSSIGEILLAVQGKNQELNFSPALIAAVSIGAILMFFFVVRRRVRGSTSGSIKRFASRLTKISEFQPPILVAAIGAAFFFLLADPAAVLAKCPGIPSNPNSGGPDITTLVAAALGGTVAAILIVLIFLRKRKVAQG